MAISSGSFSMGSGGTYATPNTARADIDAGGLTGDMTLTLISNVVENVADDISDIPLNGFTLTITSDNKHKGVFGAGNIISLADQISFRVSGTGIIDFGFLQCDFDSGAVAVSFSVFSSGPTMKFHDNLIDGSGGQSLIFQAINNTGGISEVYNNIHANSDNAGLPDLMEIIAGAFPLKLFNNVCDCRGSAFSDGFKIESHTQAPGVFIANNIALVAAGRSGYIYVGTDSGLIAGNYMYNNATTDASTLTGSTDPIHDVVPATEFVSDIFGDTDYLKPLETSQFKHAGIATNNPTTVDITGAPYA